MVESTIISVLWIAFVLYLLFETSAVYEYTKLLSPYLPEWITRMREYEQIGAPCGISYGEYMKTSRDSFMMRMATCPVCLGTWLSIGAALIAEIPLAIPAIYIGSQLIYRMMRDTQHGTDE